MPRLESDFEAKLEEAILDELEAEAEAIAQEMLDLAEEKWRAYAEANDYDIDHVWEDAEATEISRDDDSVTVRVVWPFSAMFEFGVDPHVIEASEGEVLAFPWPEMEGVEFGDTGQTFDEVFAETWPIVFFPKVNWGSKTGGIPKARAVRDMLRELRGEMRE